MKITSISSTAPNKIWKRKKLANVLKFESRNFFVCSMPMTNKMSQREKSQRKYIEMQLIFDDYLFLPSKQEKFCRLGVRNKNQVETHLRRRRKNGTHVSLLIQITLSRFKMITISHSFFIKIYCCERVDVIEWNFVSRSLDYNNVTQLLC